MLSRLTPKRPRVANTDITPTNQQNVTMMSSSSEHILTPTRPRVANVDMTPTNPCELFSVVRTVKLNKEVLVLNELLEPIKRRCAICLTVPYTIALVHVDIFVFVTSVEQASNDAGLSHVLYVQS